MAQKAFPDGFNEATERRQVRSASAGGPDGRPTSETGSLSLQVTVYANMLQHTSKNGGDGLAPRSVLLFEGTIPVDLNLVPEASRHGAGSPGVIDLPPATHAGNGAGDPWSDLEQSARYLGISTSTLYKYSSQGKIECRKIAGKLQFRQSELDEFLKKQIRPARKGRNSASIIPPALCSGK
jgi:excisionase family DNA binding protein